MKPSSNPYLRSLRPSLLGISVVLASAGLTATSALADATWDGSESQNWADVNNWTATPSGSLTINTATGNFPVISANNTFTVSNLYLARQTGGTVSGRLDLGAELTTTGVIHINSGQNNVTNSTGVLNVTNGGTLNSQGDLVVSFAGSTSASGELNIATGGTVNVGTTAERWLIINQWDGAQGRLNVNGGNLNLANNTDIRFSTGNSSAIGASSLTLNTGNITGGAGSVIDLNRASGSASTNNTFHLNGGVATIGAIETTNNAGTAVVNFNGGTLKAAAANVNFLNLGGASQRANVRNGGAIVNSNGFDVTIAQALLHSNVGGDNAVDGGLTKDGGGTLTISAANTFTGATTVNGGTLYLTAANAANNRGLSFTSGVTVNNGGTLRSASNSLFGWDGTQDKNILVNAGGTLTADSGADVGVATVTLAGGTLANLGASATWGSWRFDNATDKLSVTENSTISAVNVKFGHASAALEVASGKTASFTGTITDATSGGISYLNKTGDGNLTLTGSNTFTGATTISAGTLQLGDGTTDGAITSSSGITNNAALAYNLTGTHTFANPVTGSGSLTKNGAGSLTLSGANNLGGSTTLNGGTLKVRGTLGAVTVADSPSNVFGNATNATLSMGSLSFGGDATLNLLLNSAPALSASGALSTTPANGTVTINAGNTLWTIGANPIISYGSFAGSLSDFTLGTITGLSSRQSSNGLINTGSAIALDVVGDLPVWSGANGGVWTTATTGDNSGPNNWATKIGQSGTNFWVNDVVEFNDTVDLGTGPVAPTTTTVSISGGVSTTTVAFNNSALDYTINSSDSTGITAGSVLKSGGGKVTINTANTYTGGTTINGGTISISAASALGAASGALTVNNGTLQTTADLTSTRVVTLGHANSTLLTDAGTTHTVSGTVSGSGALNKTGAGTLVLGAANSYTGGTNIQAGTLRITTTAGAANSGAINLGGGTFQIDLGTGTNFGYAPAITLSADSTIGNAAAGSNANLGGQINFTGTLNGGGNALNIASTGLARLYMNGTHTNVSQFNVLSGVMGFDINSANNRGTAPVVVSNGASLWFAGNNANPITNDLTFNGGNGTNAGGALYYEGGSATPAALGGNINLAGGNTGVGTAFAADTITFNGTISGPGALTQIKGNTILSGNNTYSGGTTIASGVMTANTHTALGTGAVSVSAVSGAQLRLASGVNVANDITLAGGGVVAQGVIHVPTGDATYSGNVNITGVQNAGGHFASGTGALTISGNVTSSVPVTVRSGTVIFSGTGSSFSNLVVQAGTVKLGADNPLPTGATVDLGLSAAATLDLGGYDQSIAAVSKNANGATITNSGASDSTLTITGTSTFAGVVQDGGTNKTGITVNGGNLTLSGANTYTGDTMVSAGTLFVSGSLGNSNVSVANGATIGGTGSIGGSLNLASGSTLDVTSGSLTVAGLVSFGSFGFADIVGFDVFTADLGTYTLISGSNFDFSNVSNFGLANALDLGGGKSAYFQSGSLQVVVIPEPGAALLGGLGVLALLRRRRR